MEKPIFTSPESRKKVYQNLFHPKSIAVIGASNNGLKPGGRVIEKIKAYGYEGKLWPVNPKSLEILNIKAYPSISELPGTPDLAIIAIPSRFVLPALQALAIMGAGAVIVLTAGFGEKDEAGKEIEQEMLKIAASADMALIGPNCSGFLTKCYKGKFAGIVPHLPGGVVDVISGSGATVDYVMEMGLNRGLSFGNVVNLGNSIQMGVEDLLELYNENYGPDNARILMLYMETVKKPAKLLHHARSLVKKGCAIVGIKSGATEAGERAAASHTGAIANSDTAVAALFKKAGIIRVESRSLMVNVACVLAAAKGPLKGGRACILTDAGGPGVMMSDELYRQGMELAKLKETTVSLLAQVLPAESSLINPIDTLPSRTPEQMKAIFKILAREEDDNIDVIAVLLGNSGMSPNIEIYREIAKAMDTCPIPIMPMLSSITSCREEIKEMIDLGKIYLPDEVPLAQALAKIAGWQCPQDALPDLDGYDKIAIAKALEGQTDILSPETVEQVIKGCGFKLPEQCEVRDDKKLATSCDVIGFPLVMKVIGPLHKSDVGGVKVGIQNMAQAKEAWDALMAIPDAKGALLQTMIQGTEVIAGASREGEFGHLIMFGLGGIYVEVLKDVQFGLAPLSPRESMNMIQGINSYAVLEGVRGEAGMDIAMLSDYLQRLGRLVTDFPQIREIDLNPIKGTEKALYAVDARIIIS